MPLRESFGKHLGETQQQAVRLEKALQILGPGESTQECAPMKALIAEGEEGIANTPAGTATRDASLVLSAQRVEHYEIAAYGGLIEIAKMLGYREIAGLLYASLTEEKGADKALTLVGEGGINYSAAKEG
jgi:ferritin-like metal-binding protein YciE